MKVAILVILTASVTVAQELPQITTLSGDTLAGTVDRVDDERTLVVTTTDGDQRELAIDDLEEIVLPDAKPLQARDVPGRLWLRSGLELPVAWVDGEGGSMRVDVGLTERGAPATFDLRHVAALRIGPADVEGGEAFERASGSPPTTDDLLFAWNRQTGALTRLSVKVLGFDGRDVRVDFRGERSLPVEQVHGFVMGTERGTRPELAPLPRATVWLEDGPVLAGRLARWQPAVVDLRLDEGATLHLPAESVGRIEFASSQVARLSDLSPLTVEQTPAFDRVRPWLRDRAPGGDGVALGGRTWRHGLCLFPFTAVTFAVGSEGGEFDRFEALVGIDERSENPLADVVVRVRLDGEVAVEIEHVRAGGPPRPIRVPLGDAKTLTLEVDFGRNLDLGDHCVFADPRVLKS